MSDERVILRVQQWHTECGACGHGRGGWASSPALKGEPILGPDSRACPKCGQSFTHIEDPYAGTLEPIEDAA